MIRAKKLALGLLTWSSLTLSGCTDAAGYDLDYFWGYIPFMATLRGSVGYDPYEMPRVPAEHSIPVITPIGEVPPPFTQAQLDSAAATLSNPYAANPAPEVLATGKLQYDRQCSTCHGEAGQGAGPVVGNGKFPFAPAINGATTAGRSDGYLYGVIAVGRGLMPPYGERMAHLERWATVAYLRQLQRQAGVAPAPGATPPSAPAPGPRPPVGQPADTLSVEQTQ